MTREQAADLYAEENGDATKFFDYDIARAGFLAGCEHADKEHRERIQQQAQEIERLQNALLRNTTRLLDKIKALEEREQEQAIKLLQAHAEGEQTAVRRLKNTIEELRDKITEQAQEIERLKKERDECWHLLKQAPAKLDEYKQRITELETQLKEVKEIARDEINISAISESSRSKLDRIYKLLV